MLGRPHETSRSQERRCVRMGGMCTAGVCDKNRYSDSHESPTCHVALGSANRLRSLRVRKNFEACLSFEVSFEVLSINTAVVETFEVSTHALYFRPWLENTTVSHCRNGCEERVRTMLGGGSTPFRTVGATWATQRDANHAPFSMVGGGSFCETPRGRSFLGMATSWHPCASTLCATDDG